MSSFSRAFSFSSTGIADNWPFITLTTTASSSILLIWDSSSYRLTNHILHNEKAISYHHPHYYRIFLHLTDLGLQLLQVNKSHITHCEGNIIPSPSLLQVKQITYYTLRRQYHTITLTTTASSSILLIWDSSSYRLTNHILHTVKAISHHHPHYYCIFLHLTDLGLQLLQVNKSHITQWEGNIIPSPSLLPHLPPSY